MLDAFDFERFTGVDWFLSSGPGTGGKLRFLPEDFVVEEMGEPRPGEGVFALKIKHMNWESGALKERIRRDTGAKEDDITFAGTKDKRAVVTHWITINRRTAPVLNIEGVDVLESRPTSCLLRSGEHDGNRFVIRIRSVVGEDEAMGLARSVMDELTSWPNFFGIQRFGAYRSVTHLAGRALVKSGAEEAVKTYIGYVGNAVGEERDARELFASRADFVDVLEAMPKHLVYERRMLRHLAGCPEDYHGALMSLPRGLVQFLIHGYQSYLFNRILSKRLEAGLPLNSPVDGDLLLPPAARHKGGQPRFVPVTSANAAVSADAVARGKGCITAALPGSDSPLAKGEPGELEMRILEEEGLVREHFSIPHLPGMSSRGTRRAVSISPDDMGLWWDDGVMLSFALPPGGYATTILREIMKSSDPLSY